MSNDKINKKTMHKQLPRLVVSNIKKSGSNVPLLAFEIRYGAKTVYLGVASERERPDGEEGLALSVIGQAILETINHFKSDDTRPVVINFKAASDIKAILVRTFQNIDTGSIILCTVTDAIVSQQLLKILDDNTAFFAGEIIAEGVEYSEVVSDMFDNMVGHGVIAANASTAVN